MLIRHVSAGKAFGVQNISETDLFLLYGRRRGFQVDLSKWKIWEGVLDLLAVVFLVSRGMGVGVCLVLLPLWAKLFSVLWSIWALLVLVGLWRRLCVSFQPFFLRWGFAAWGSLSILSGRCNWRLLCTLCGLALEVRGGPKLLGCQHTFPVWIYAIHTHLFAYFVCFHINDLWIQATFSRTGNPCFWLNFGENSHSVNERCNQIIG